MFFIDETYFKGELTIPQLPTSYVGEDEALFGTALMIQTAAENNLFDFIDTKTVEWLTYMYGEELANELAGIWALISNPENVDTVTTSVGRIQNSTPPNVKVMQEFSDSPFYYYFDSFFSTNEGCSGIAEPLSETNVNSVNIKNYLVGGYRYNLITEYFKNVRVVVPDDWYTTCVEIKRKSMTAPIPNVIKGIIGTILTRKGTVKCSPIANYVYYWLNRDAQNYTTAMGEADLNFSRASNAYEADKFIKANANRNKLIRAWNAMIPMNVACINYLREHRSELSGYSFKGMNHELLVSSQNVFNI